MLPRHPNPIWEQAACDDLFASFIADGHHLDSTYAPRPGPGERTGADDPRDRRQPARGPAARDATASGPSSRRARSSWRARPTWRARTVTLEESIRRVLASTNWPLRDVLAAVTTNPARVLRHREPRLEVGEPANLVIFTHREPGHFGLSRVCIDGQWSNEMKTTRAAPAEPAPPGSLEIPRLGRSIRPRRRGPGRRPSRPRGAGTSRRRAASPRCRPSSR